MAKANAKDKSASAALHPPYFEMIADAISSLKERNGSSQQAIAKFMEEKHSKVLPPNFRKVLSIQLKKFVRSERLLKVKNSFKLTSMEKLKLTIKETQKAKNPVAKAKQKADKITEKAIKTKRLSQVKTPDALRKANKDANDKFPTSSAGKRKRLTQLNSPMPTNRATK